MRFFREQVRTWRSYSGLRVSEQASRVQFRKRFWSNLPAGSEWDTVPKDSTTALQKCHVFKRFGPTHKKSKWSLDVIIYLFINFISIFFLLHDSLHVTFKVLVLNTRSTWSSVRASDWKSSTGEVWDASFELTGPGWPLTLLLFKEKKHCNSSSSRVPAEKRLAGSSCSMTCTRWWSSFFSSGVKVALILLYTGVHGSKTTSAWCLGLIPLIPRTLSLNIKTHVSSSPCLFLATPQGLM